MKKILRSHPNVVIGVLAIALLAVMVVFYIWTIDNVFVALHLALMAPVPNTSAGFDLSTASTLDLHGLAGTPAPSTASTTPTSTSAATTTPL
jgi:hypothetical protein